MKTKNEHIPNQIADFDIQRDVLGQIRTRGITVFRKLKYKSVNAPELNVIYASLTSRIFAFLIDLGLVANILIIIETFFVNSSFENPDTNYFRILTGALIWILYNSLLESSIFQATIGEMLLKLKIVDLFGKKISVLRALSRCITTIISILPFGLGIWYITTDPKKQSWHDLIAGTFVIKNTKK